MRTGWTNSARSARLKVFPGRPQGRSPETRSSSATSSRYLSPIWRTRTHPGFPRRCRERAVTRRSRPSDHVTIAQQMAEFVFDLEWPDVPTHVEIAARRHLADTLACAVGAYREQPVRALRDYAVETRSRGGATLLGSSERTSPAMASLVNGTMVRYLDANDISSFGGGHFSDGVPPFWRCPRTGACRPET